jgi:hypothetical protein
VKIISKLAQKKKAAEAWAPGMVTTDVGEINEKSLISCFLGQRYERFGGVEKTMLIQNINSRVAKYP